MKRRSVTFGHLPYVAPPPSGANRYDDFGLLMQGLWGLRKMKDDYIGPIARVRNTNTQEEVDLFAGESGVIEFDDPANGSNDPQWKSVNTPVADASVSNGWADTFRVRVKMTELGYVIPQRLKIRLSGYNLTTKAYVAKASGSDLDITGTPVQITFGGVNPFVLDGGVQTLSDEFDLPAGMTLDDDLIFSFYYQGDIVRAGGFSSNKAGYITGDHATDASFAGFTTAVTVNTIHEIQAFVKAGPKAYTRWRLRAIGGTTGNPFIRIQRIYLRDENAVDLVVAKGGSAFGDAGLPAEAFNDNGATYWDSNSILNQSHYLGWQFPTPQFVKTFYFQTRESEGNSLSRFAIEASNDGATWDIIVSYGPDSGAPIPAPGSYTYDSATYVPPTAEWAVSRLYDQSGYNQTLVQTVADFQPKLKRNQFPSGNPGIVFDGSDDFLIDIDTTTNTRAYMVADPVWIVMGKNLTQLENYPTIAQIPHQNNSDTNPYTRCGIVLRDLSNGGFRKVSVKFGGVENADMDFLHMERDYGIFAMSMQPKSNRIRNTGTDSRPSPSTADTTYPNPTGMYVGVSGSKSTGNWHGVLFELGVMKGTAADPADLELRKDKMAASNIYGRNNMMLWIPMTNTDNSANYSGADLKAFIEDDPANIFASPIYSTGTVRFNTSESWENLFDENPATLWSATSSFWPVLSAVLQPRSDDSRPTSGSLTWRNDQYYNGSVRTFYFLFLDTDGWHTSANIDIGAPAVQGQTRGFNINYP